MPFTYKIILEAAIDNIVKKTLDAVGIKYIIEGNALIIPHKEVVKAEKAFQSLAMAQLAFRKHLASHKHSKTDMYWPLKI